MLRFHLYELVLSTFPEAFLLNSFTVLCDQILAYMQDI